MPDPRNPLIVQSDRSVLVETAAPRYAEARDGLVRFAELEKSPEHIHTYRITPLSLWNAAAAGMRAEEVVGLLRDLTKYELPGNVVADIREYMGRYGRLTLTKEEDGSLLLHADSEVLLTEILHHKPVVPHLEGRLGPLLAAVRPDSRGPVKQALLAVGYPVDDRAGYVDGAPLEVSLRDVTREGKAFGLRDYQREAVASFHVDGTRRGGSGTIVLPCGAGKTVVGLGVMARVRQHTLILGTSITAIRQWRDEILDKTDLTEDQIGEYSGECKEIRPVTLATYQILVSRRSRSDEFVHFGIFDRGNWGLIIYDEVHLLPAPVFRVTAEIQSRRRLGLTATLVREDGLEGDVFSLIGPKRFDVPWRVLERRGWIASAFCTEIRVPFESDDHRLEYAVAGGRERFRLASENPRKMAVLEGLLERHRGDRILVIGQYLDQVEGVARRIRAPLVTGETPNREREVLFERFRRGLIPVLVVSRVANFALDLPDANVAIQVSGSFGSRQEEAQRLGRILRPKTGENRAHFYTLVTRDSVEQEFAARRQLFLTEQGYRYEIVVA